MIIFKIITEYDPKDFDMTPEEAKMFDVQQVYVFELPKGST